MKFFHPSQLEENHLRRRITLDGMITDKASRPEQGNHGIAKSQRTRNFKDGDGIVLLELSVEQLRQFSGLLSLCSRLLEKAEVSKQTQRKNKTYDLVSEFSNPRFREYGVLQRR